MQIYERIFELLRMRCMSQKELSDRTGIRQSTISDWKNKKVNPSSDKITLICNALDIHPNELLVGTEQDAVTGQYIYIDKKSEEYQLIKNYRNMSTEQRNRLIGYMEALKHLT